MNGTTQKHLVSQTSVKPSVAINEILIGCKEGDIRKTNRTEEELPPVCAVVMVCLKKSFALAFFSSKFQSCLIVFANDTIFFIKTLC